MRLRAWLIVVYLVVTAEVARTDTCVPLPGPTSLTAQLVTDADTSTTDYVALTWTPGPKDDSRRQWLGYRVERRDDTAGGGFVSFLYLAAGNINASTARDYTNGAPFFTCTRAEGCAEEGHTYTYRVVTEFRYSQVFCPDTYDGMTHESPSNEVQITIPAPPPVNSAPKNVVAVAEGKKPVVHLRWELPDGDAPDGFEIRRRVIDPAAKSGPRAANFAKLFQVAGDATDYVDKDTVPDEEYEYVIATIVAGEVQEDSQSKPDAAYTQPKQCPQSDFDIWEGPWQTKIGGIDHLATFGSAPDGKRYVVNFRDLRRTETSEFGTILAAGLAPALVKRKTLWNAKAVVAAVDVTVGSLPPWANGVVQGDKGTFRIFMKPRDRFDAKAWRAMEMEIRFPTIDDNLFLDFDLDTGEDNGEIDFPTTLCAKAAAGVPNADLDDPVVGKYRAVKAGENVLFLFTAVSLGQSPLWSGRCAVDVTLTNATILQTTEVGAVVLGNPANAKTARFILGAIGPDKKGNSERAVILVAATVVDDGKLPQVTCKFEFVSDAEGLKDVDRQPLKLHQAKPVELIIDRSK